jgi:hypothetical protein
LGKLPRLFNGKGGYFYTFFYSKRLSTGRMDFNEMRAKIGYLGPKKPKNASKLNKK